MVCAANSTFPGERAEVNGLTGTLTKSYEWDPRKPNGVGGLLAITTYDAGEAVTGTYRPVYDGNANITALVDLSTGTVVATYRYTAFGICVAAGTGADICNFRFGGMYWQASAQLYCDHARDYDPALGPRIPAPTGTHQRHLPRFPK